MASANAWERVYIIGIGADGIHSLNVRERELLQAADLVLGSDNTLSLLPELQAERYAIGADVQAAADLIEKNLGRRRMVVVALGDPLFYGIARYLCDRLGKEHFEILPHASLMQTAFARVKESWEEAYLTSLATHPLEEILERIRSAEMVGLFTTQEQGPSYIARTLRDHGLDDVIMYVCENLGTPQERVTRGNPADIAGMDFSPLNVVILKRTRDRVRSGKRPACYRRFGNPDHYFTQRWPKCGLVTPAEVRALALALLDIQPTSVVWDIGAGSGSVAIEAAHLAERGRVYAIESDPADYPLLVANAEAFGVNNLEVIQGPAPAVLADLPAPQAIFVGGIGHEIARVLQVACAKLQPGGHLVVHVADLESAAEVYRTLEKLGPVGVLLVQVARGVRQFDRFRFDPIAPSFLLSVTRPDPKREEPKA
ncbi:MAG: cobalamin biosynthesis bifunctional protein CbiET [Gemmataceae bacterium]